MKKIFVYSLLTVLAITGCQAEQEVLNPDNKPEVITQESTKVFTAIVDDDFSGDTKTSLDGEGNVLWKKNDQMSIFAGSTVNEHYQVTDASDGNSAATLNKIPDEGSIVGTAIDNNVAFYPYASTAELSKSGSSYVISGIELPATQTYVAGSFGNGAFPMATVTSSTGDMNLKFKNVLGGLKLQLKGTATITSITVTGNNNEILCGDAEVTMAYGGVPSISLSDASAKTVTLDCGAGVTLDSETATPFIITLPPMTMTGGFTVVVNDSEGKQMEIKTTKSQTITRSINLKMPAVNYVGATPFTITSTGTTSVGIYEEGTPYDIVLEYKKADGDWTSYTIGSSIDLSDGEALKFRSDEDGNDNFSKGISDYYYFKVEGSGTITASGNIMSLLDRSMERISVPGFAFSYLFSGCGTKLSTASDLKLPATTLASNCYYFMFLGCRGITTTPVLPATTLAERCYQGMFAGCSGLTSAPTLPATTLADYCYTGMFQGCTSLTSAPELPATTLEQECYEGMFYDCTNLTSAPELPATTLAGGCYYQMFSGCTSLSSAPALPATTLRGSCYYQMFYGCTSLTTAPVLPATTLVGSCYSGMFYGCSNLNYVKALFTTTPSASYTSEWLYGVAATGTFVKSNSATWDVTGVNGVPSGWAVETPMASPLKFTSTGSTSISLTKTGSPDAITLEYKVDDGEWASYTVGDAINLTNGQELSFMAGVSGNSSFSQSSSNYYKFTVTGSGTVAASGNIMSLLNREGGLTIPSDYCFCYLFYNFTSLTTAPELPATTLANGCYMGMFLRCTGLTTAPELPATTLANGCYMGMFQGCAGLTTAPELPATTLTDRCYTGMFYSCTGLTTAPELPATTLTFGCYASMFCDCPSLTTAPDLPATTLANLCYTKMFEGCTKLNYIKALFTTTPSSSYTFDWVYGVAASGTFVKSSSATWNVTGSNGVPSGWAVLTE